MNKVLPIYNAEVTAGSLLLKESRAIAQLLLQGADDKTWHQALVIDNVLQKTSPTSTKRMAKLIRKRLEPMPAELLTIVAEGSTEIAIQALLATAIKHSR